MNKPFEIVADRRQLTDEQWLELRRTGIGGSEAGWLMPVNDYDKLYKTPLLICADKLGKGLPVEDNDAMKNGRMWEPIIRNSFASVYKEDAGIEIEVRDYPYMCKSTQYPFMLSNIDGEIVHPVFGLGGIEIKSHSEYQAKYWENDSVPDVHYGQIHHYMGVMGYRFFFVIALIGNKLIHRIVHFNQSYFNELVERESDLWNNYVAKGILPAPSGTDDEGKLLLNMYGDSKDKSVDLTHLKKEIAFHTRLKAAIDKLEIKKKKIETAVKTELGTNKYGKIDGVQLVTWSRFKQRRFKTEPFKKECPDLYAKYSEESDSGRLYIKGSDI